MDLPFRKEVGVVEADFH